MKLGDAYVELTTRDRLDSGLNQARAKTESWVAGVQKRMADAFTFAAGGVIQAGLGALAAGVRSVGDAMIGGNAQFEQYGVQLEVLLKSAEAARARLAELQAFNVATPFELPELVQADMVLQNFGFHAADAAKRFGFSGAEIRRIAGDVASGSKASLEEVATYLGRFASGQTGMTLARFEELGIVTRQQLRQLGLSFDAQGSLIIKSQQDVDQALSIILQQMSTKYDGLAAKQATTFSGMMSNLQDWFANAARVVGQPIFDALKANMQSLLQVLNSDQVSQALTGFASGLGAFVDGLLSGITNIGNALALADIAGQIDAINASLGAGQGVMISWRDIGLELAKGLGQAAIEFRYVGDWGRLTATSIQQLWLDLASWFQATFANGVLVIVREAFKTIGIEARIAWATITGDTDALTVAMNDLVASQNRVRGAIQSFGVEGKFWFNELIADAGRYAAATERLNQLKAGQIGQLNAVGGQPIGPMPRPADMDKWGAGLIPPARRAAETIKTVFTDAATGAGNAWKKAFDDASSFISSKLTDAQNALKGLLPDMFPADAFGPGANGPFENIFRAADVAKQGEASPWAAKLGLTQEQAKKIVQDFANGLFTDDVKNLIDMQALIDDARLKQTAETMKAKFVSYLAGAAGTSTSVVDSLLGTETGVSSVQTKIADPLVTAFNTVTTAINNLIAALERLAKTGIPKPSTGSGTSSGTSGGGERPPQAAPNYTVNLGPNGTQAALAILRSRGRAV